MLCVIELAEAERQADQVVDQAAAGRSFLITENGRPIVKLLPYQEDAPVSDRSPKLRDS